MINVMTSCPTCGDITVPETAVSVTENKTAPEWSTYAFTCPECGKLITHPATFDVLAALAMGTKRVKWNVVNVPTELNEPHTGPALTEDDFLAFGKALHDTPAHLISILAGGDK